MHSKSSLLRSKTDRGVAFATIVMVVFFVSLIWLTAHWAIGYFGTTKAQKILIESLLKNKDIVDDEMLKAALIDDLKKNGPIVVEAKDLNIFRSQDGKSVKITMPLDHVVTVPLTSVTFSLPFSLDFDERLDRARAF